MRRIFWVVSSLVVLGALNFFIYQKEAILTSSKTMLLELAPVDPRSLMQGDYMELAFAIERDPTPGRDGVNFIGADGNGGYATMKSGFIVLEPDADGVGRFVRIDASEPIGPNQMRIRFERYYYGGIRLRPRSFMFEEGTADRYAEAKYGVYRYNDAGDALLIGLAGADRVLIPAH